MAQNIILGFLAVLILGAYSEESVKRTSLGTNSSMFANCSSFGDVREVRSSVLGLKVMFGEVRSSVLMFGEHYEHFGVIKYPIFCLI